MDDEITSMFQVGKILDALDEEARGRVVRWAADKYGIELGQTNVAAEEAAESPESTMFASVDPEKMAALKAGREAKAEATTSPNLEVQPASTLEPDESPPPRDPERPSFLDTSFRMHSGKKELKKAKNDKQ